MRTNKWLYLRGKLFYNKQNGNVSDLEGEHETRHNTKRRAIESEHLKKMADKFFFVHSIVAVAVNNGLKSVKHSPKAHYKQPIYM